MDNPFIQRVSFEDIQEFKNLDLFDLTLEQTGGRSVLLAYDPVSQTFSYAYAEDGVETGNGNLSIYYGYGALLSSFIDSSDPASRPSINGFKDGDGIIANSTTGTINQFDFYEVSISEDLIVDTYVFKENIIDGGGTPTIVSDNTPAEVIDGGTWFQPVSSTMYVGNSGSWDPVIGPAGTDGVDGLPGTPGTDGIDGAPGTPGEDGDPGLVYKTSTVFTRTSTLFEDKTVIVTGGSWSDPFPTETTIEGVPTVVQWFDGIPSGEEKVWMTTFTYNDGVPDIDDPTNIWSFPSGITDTGTTDFQYSTVLNAPGTPDTIPGNWDEEIVDPTAVIWIAQRSISNGIFGPWKVWRVKGETGAQGNGLDIKGRDTPCNILNKGGVADYDIWLANSFADIATMQGCSGFTMDADANPNDAFLKLPDGTGEGGSNWDNIGPVVGTDGASFLYSIIYRRFVGNPGAPTGLGDFANPVPVDWSDGIPALILPIPEGQQLWMTSRHFSDDPTSNDALADWIIPSVAADSNDQEFSYAYMQPGDAEPASPDVSPELWSDIPGETEYYWMAKANKINGVVDDSSWKINRIRGEQGVSGLDGEDAISQFMASAYIKTETDISGAVVEGGSYLSPVPTTQAAGQDWSDGIPDGPGATWFVQVQMLQTDDGSSTKVWPSPIKIIDTSSIEYMFSEDGTGLPVEGNDGLNGWWDNAEDVPGTPNYMAIGSIVNGIWPTSWDIVQITGEEGQPGTGAYTYVPSSMFCRCEDNDMASKLITGKYLTQSGGTFILDGADPTTTVNGKPYTFTDGIPELTTSFPNNGKRVWMIQGVLNDNDNLGLGNEYEWGNPVVLADNGTIDYQYHAGSTATEAGAQPAPPSGSGSNPDTNGWWDSPDLMSVPAFWVAQKNWAEGPGAAWVVYQIRGEDGEDGADATISYTYTPTYLTGTGVIIENGFYYNIINSATSEQVLIDAPLYQITSRPARKYNTGGGGGYPNIGDRLFNYEDQNSPVNGLDEDFGNPGWNAVIRETSAGSGQWQIDDYYIKLTETGYVADVKTQKELLAAVPAPISAQQSTGYSSFLGHSLSFSMGNADPCLFITAHLQAKSNFTLGGKYYAQGTKVSIPYQTPDGSGVRGLQTSFLSSPQSGYYTTSVNIMCSSSLKVYGDIQDDGDVGYPVTHIQWSLIINVYFGKF